MHHLPHNQILAALSSTSDTLLRRGCCDHRRRRRPPALTLVLAVLRATQAGLVLAERLHPVVDGKFFVFEDVALCNDCDALISANSPFLAAAVGIAAAVQESGQRALKNRLACDA